MKQNAASRLAARFTPLFPAGPQASAARQISFRPGMVASGWPT
ncbi:hypothetical protein ACI3L1_19760 [Deinococcus sp. SM5_A1]